jgi:probable phosphomutase (TIGR03848 family)
MSTLRPTTARRGLLPPPATLVLFVRHAHAKTTGVILSGRTPGLHLSRTGQRQAEAVAGRIGLLPKIAAVYTSPLERARETATPIARARRLPVRLERGLIEVDVGQWTGASLTHLRRRREWAVVQHHPSGFRFPDGESFTEMQTRITTAIARLVERHPGQTIIAVSHADPIKSAIADALGAHLDLFQRIAIAPASITAIRYRPQGPTVLTVNSMDGALAVLGGR